MRIYIKLASERHCAAPAQVVCTIHQPSSDITDRFDDLLLLSGGRVIYMGPWMKAVEHFSGLGFPCARTPRQLHAVHMRAIEHFVFVAAVCNDEST